jgi:hypothetical protein
MGRPAFASLTLVNTKGVSMSETKEFSTAAVLSAITGVLVCEFGDVHQVAEFMAGGPVWTHQLPRVSLEAQSVMERRDPRITEAVRESADITPENYLTYRDMWVDRFGPMMTVPRMNAGQHESIDPLSELAEKVHPDRIIAVVTDPIP